MNTNSRKLWKHAAGCLASTVILSMACRTTAMANDIVHNSVSVSAYTSGGTDGAALMPMSASETITSGQQTRTAEDAAKALAWQQAKAAEEAARILAQQQEEARIIAWQQEVAAAQTAIAAQKGITPQDLEVLAALIQCEAGGESYVGQVAVGNVVMNRMESGAHPNTVMGVIYEAGQFTPAGNGRLSRTLQSGRISPSCRQAALEAVAGSEPVGDKLYFRRVNGRSGQIIGNHVFY